ncbi:hypothetical protein KI387_026424, partial [Taxus chinensis]
MTLRKLSVSFSKISGSIPMKRTGSKQSKAKISDVVVPTSVYVVLKKEGYPLDGFHSYSPSTTSVGSSCVRSIEEFGNGAQETFRVLLEGLGFDSRETNWFETIQSEEIRCCGSNECVCGNDGGGYPSDGFHSYSSSTTNVVGVYPSEEQAYFAGMKQLIQHFESIMSEELTDLRNIAADKKLSLKQRLKRIVNEGNSPDDEVITVAIR